MHPLPLALLAGGLLGLPLLAAPQTVGDLVQAPDGAYFQLDPHRGGDAGEVRLRRVAWGRLVDVHGLDADGARSARPVLEDVVVRPDLADDGVDYALEHDPVTGTARLVILRRFRGAGDGADPFVALLQEAQRGLPEVAPKGPGTPPPFAAVPRNAALVLQVDDLLADGPREAARLPETVRVLAGYPPAAPAAVRAFFDASHGGVAGGGFHATRVVLDLTVSAVEAGAMATPAPRNALGLPASEPGRAAPNVAVRIPTRTHPATGQVAVLTNLAGRPLSAAGGPSDPGAPTADVVRALRSGSPEDDHGGFLVDLQPPRLLGRWPASVDAAVDAPGGTPGLDFVVTLGFGGPCRSAPEVGDVIATAGGPLQVVADAEEPDAAGVVDRVAATSLVGPTSAGALLGGAAFVRPYEPGVLDASLDACWLSITPAPGASPGGDVDPVAQVGLLFSEPIDPATVLPYDTFAIGRDRDPTAHEIVPAEVVASPDLTEFVSIPLLPLAHAQGSAETYVVWLGDDASITDLAGNPLVLKPRAATIALDPDAPSDANGGVVLRFSAVDELQVPPAAAGAGDVRGQFSYDLAAGVLRPRPVMRFAAVADRTQVVPSAMLPYPAGVQTPLNPLGAKTMSVWRHADVGMSATDESNHNLDVEGLAWSPAGGAVISDFFPELELRLSHGRYLPDEHLSGVTLLPTYPDSGLAAATFAENVLDDPEGPQEVVHAKALGYSIDPADVFTSTTGTPMIPWPLNQGDGPYETYLWRDTAVRSEAAPNGAGIEQHVMADLGLIPPGTEGAVAGPGAVPSIGLPLLTEVRTYPSPTSIGLNALDVSIAVNTSRLPAFRVFSAGGFDAAGFPVTVDPDLEPVPSGGFEPTTGQPTPPDDNVFHVGQMDVVTRVSRAHTVWIDTQVDDGSTSFLAQVLPSAGGLPDGTEVVVHWRGASALSGAAVTGAFDAELIDPYGAVRPSLGAYLGDDAGVTFFPPGDATWKDDLAALDGARYVQARVTFVGNETTLDAAELSSLAIAFDRQ